MFRFLFGDSKQQDSNKQPQAGAGPDGQGKCYKITLKGRTVQRELIIKLDNSIKQAVAETKEVGEDNTIVVRIPAKDATVGQLRSVLAPYLTKSGESIRMIIMGKNLHDGWDLKDLNMVDRSALYLVGTCRCPCEVLKLTAAEQAAKNAKDNRVAAINQFVADSLASKNVDEKAYNEYKYEIRIEKIIELAANGTETSRQLILEDLKQRLARTASTAELEALHSQISMNLSHHKLYDLNLEIAQLTAKQHKLLPKPIPANGMIALLEKKDLKDGKGEGMQAGLSASAAVVQKPKPLAINGNAFALLRDHKDLKDGKGEGVMKVEPPAPALVAPARR